MSVEAPDTDLTDRRLMEVYSPSRQATSPAGLRCTACRAGRSPSRCGCDFTTLSRSTTLVSPRTVRRRSPGWREPLLVDLDTSGGVRLLGVGVSRARGLGPGGPVRRDGPGGTGTRCSPRSGPHHPRRAWAPGMDVVPRRARPRVGLGLGARGRDRAVPRPRVARRTGALLPRRRPGAQSLAAPEPAGAEGGVHSQPAPRRARAQAVRNAPGPPARPPPRPGNHRLHGGRRRRPRAGRREAPAPRRASSLRGELPLPRTAQRRTVEPTGRCGRSAVTGYDEPHSTSSARRR